MDNPAFSSQINDASCSFPFLQTCSFSHLQSRCDAEAEIPGKAFSRQVVEAANVLSAMCSGGATENDRQMPTGHFHNPFENPQFEKRSVTVFVKQRENAPLKQSVKVEEQYKGQAPKYIPSKERFSIESLLDFGQSTSKSSSGSDRHHPLAISNSSANNQDRIDTSSKPMAQVAITGDTLLTANLQQYGITPKGPVYTACEPDSNQSLQDTDSSDSRLECQRECYNKMQDPKKRELIKQRNRTYYIKRMQDPIKRELIKQRNRERRKDPEKRELLNKRDRESYYKKMQDPKKRELLNQSKREGYNKRMQDPIKRELRKQRQREFYNKRMQDPIKRELRKQRQREFYNKRMQDPTKREQIKQRRREQRQAIKKRKLIIASNQNWQSLLTSRIDGFSLTSSFAENTPGLSKNADEATPTRFSVVRLKESLQSKLSLSDPE